MTQPLRAWPLSGVHSRLLHPGLYFDRDYSLLVAQREDMRDAPFKRMSAEVFLCSDEDRAPRPSGADVAARSARTAMSSRHGS